MSGLLLPALALLLVLGCSAGPPALKTAVIGYDETTAELEQQLLLLNIARWDSQQPVHFTTTSSIAATFDWTATVGVGGQLEESTGTNFFDFGLSGRASENPTFSIIPVSGQEFTKSILTPLSEDVFLFRVFQGQNFELAMRLMADGVEVQNPDGSFVRVFENDPRKEEQYREFRQLAMHLQSLMSVQQLFVRTLLFEETLVEDFDGLPRSQDITNGFEKGLRWAQKSNGHYRLTRFTAGRVIVTNYDPLTLSDR